MFFQQLLNGLVIGGMYALAALGYNMVYGLIRMMNFAHGDILMWGTQLTLTLVLSSLPFFISLPLGLAGCIIIALLVAAMAYMPLLDRPRNALVLSSVGASLLLVNVGQIVFGATIRPFKKPDILPSGIHTIGGVIVSDFQIVILATCLVLMVLLSIFVGRTKIGIAMRATSANMMAARLMGIPAQKVVYMTFAIGSFLAGIGGVMVGMHYGQVWPTMGFKIGLVAFSASILGGIGSMPGAVIGGFLIGIGEALGAAYVSSGFRDGVAFAALILILIFRPWGIIGQPETENI
jgi:branched-chain amino acid transport system permease protein